jgi:hypothetical protein
VLRGVREVLPDQAHRPEGQSCCPCPLMTWCCIQKPCINSGEAHGPEGQSCCPCPLMTWCCIQKPCMNSGEAHGPEGQSCCPCPMTWCCIQKPCMNSGEGRYGLPQTSRTPRIINRTADDDGVTRNPSWAASVGQLVYVAQVLGCASSPVFDKTSSLARGWRVGR